MKQKQSVQNQVQKELPEFAAEVATLAKEELVNRVVLYCEDAEAVDRAKDADEALKQAREESNQLAAPYKDAKKAIKLKISYILALLESRGQ